MHVYFFGGGKADGGKDDKNLLGGKGAGLAEMTNIGIPVPPGFTITTEVCTYYTAHGKTYPASLDDEVAKAMARVEQDVGMKFGDAANPLLVSVRSGARASMPGMMDTILNLGLNDATCAGIAARSGDKRFAFDAYRRFITMYSDIVLGVPRAKFDDALTKARTLAKVKHDYELSAAALEELVGTYKAIVKSATGEAFIDDPRAQLWGAIGAVFRSWMNSRAITYRKMYDIPETWGTAVNVQAMVFGNQGDDCATGVCFTRDPSTGERRFFGEYLPNAQGEDVVAGIRTPMPIMKASGPDSMEEKLPGAYQDLVKVYQRLEQHYRDMQDIEFTVQHQKLWLLQTRNGKRTAKAAVKIAVDMVGEKLIDEDTALLRVDPGSLDQLLHPSLDPKAKRKAIAKGLPASPGAVGGRVVLSAEEAEQEHEKGPVILVRTETSPEDIHGMKVAKGILTARGGMTSHAAVVARGMGKCCVAGTTAIEVDEHAGHFKVGEMVVKRGDVITLDGSTGEVFLGEIATIPATIFPEFETLLGWADARRRLKVRANADTPDDAKAGRGFGAEGIGLCRTEHMFFEADRIAAVREMILANDEAGRRTALAKILPMQRRDFVGIFEAMNGLPVTIRLLDPPLHEFLPVDGPELDALAVEMKVPADTLKRRRAMLHEFNPMLGHRGCRLGITYPEIYEIQVRAIAEAVVEVQKKGVTAVPEIMIPLVAIPEELKRLRAMTQTVCDQVFQAAGGARPAILIGTMIELPRACVVADAIAEHAEFFSFGTNDLTQTTFGLSRDDAGKFLPTYVESGVMEKDPFVALDREGVGALMKMAIEKGRKTRADIKLGICGEHGGEPSSVEFCHDIGLAYVSCSPFRVPVARLVAGQAAVREKLGHGKGVSSTA